MNIDKLYEKINKKWIGALYFYAFFIMSVCIGIIISFRFSSFQVLIAMFVCLICYSFLVPITLIREAKRNKDIKE